MANPTGESESDAVRVDFDRRLMLQFRGSAKALFSPSTSNCPSLHHVIDLEWMQEAYNLRCWVAGLSRTRRRNRLDRDGE